jgi:hypothetical protein
MAKVFVFQDQEFEAAQVMAEILCASGAKDNGIRAMGV